MTIEEAKEQLWNILFNNFRSEEKDKEALDMVIKALEQEQFINKPCVSSGVCEHDKNKVFDKIRADIINIADGRQSISVRSVIKIIDKYRKEV